MASYSVGGRSAATAATANHAGAQLWNPDSVRSLWVTQISWAKTVATADNLGLVRSTARGTPGSTVTPTVQNDDEFEEVDAVGALLDLAAFSAQPTLSSATAYKFRWHLPAAIGSGFVLPLPNRIRVRPGNGLVLVTPPATILQPADVTFWFDT
jgi:hypothetical protein